MEPIVIEVPDYWTAEVALEVVDFLEQVVQAIWRQHDGRIRRALRQQHEPFDSDCSPEGWDSDEIPF